MNTPTRAPKRTARRRTVPRRRDARMDSDGHCTVCGCEVREYEGGTDAEAIKAHKSEMVEYIKDSKDRRTKPHEAAETPKTDKKDVFTGLVPTSSATCSAHPITEKFTDNYIVNVFNAGYELACGCQYQKLTTSGDAFVCIKIEGKIVQHD